MFKSAVHINFPYKTNNDTRYNTVQQKQKLYNNRDRQKLIAIRTGSHFCGKFHTEKLDALAK
jgi:hypothetical protein